MQYNVYDGKALLNRISVIFDYLKKCEINSHKHPNNTDDIATDFIMFMNSGMCNYKAFKYGNLYFPGAFADDDDFELPMPHVNMAVSTIISDVWKKILVKLNIFWPQTLIAEKQTLSNQNLIYLTEHPNQFVQWRDEKVIPISILTLAPLIHKLFTKSLITKLIKTKPSGESASEIKKAKHSTSDKDMAPGINYNFTSTEDFLNKDTSSDWH